MRLTTYSGPNAASVYDSGGNEIGVSVTFGMVAYSVPDVDALS